MTSCLRKCCWWKTRNNGGGIWNTNNGTKVVYTGTDWTNGRPGMILVDVYKTKNGITTQLIITPHNQILNP